MIAYDQTWQALQAIILASLALFIGVQAFPALRPWRRQILIAALAVYFAGGAAVAAWYLLG